MLSKLWPPVSSVSSVTVIRGSFRLEDIESNPDSSPLLVPYQGDGLKPSRALVQGKCEGRGNVNPIRVATVFRQGQNGDFDEPVDLKTVLNSSLVNPPEKLLLLIPPLESLKPIARFLPKRFYETLVRNHVIEILRAAGWKFEDPETELIEVTFAGGDIVQIEIDCVVQLGDILLFIQFHGEQHHKNLEKVFRDAFLRKVVEQAPSIGEKIVLLEIWYNPNLAYYEQSLKDEIHSRLSEHALVPKPANSVPPRGCPEQLPLVIT